MKRNYTFSELSKDRSFYEDYGWNPPSKNSFSKRSKPLSASLLELFFKFGWFNTVNLPLNPQRNYLNSTYENIRFVKKYYQKKYYYITANGFSNEDRMKDDTFF